MRPARHPWWIIGSGAVVLHGAEAGDVHDIDVLIDHEDAAAVLAADGVDSRDALDSGAKATQSGVLASAKGGIWHFRPAPPRRSD